MAKRTAKTAKVPEHCHMCGGTNCNCSKISGFMKVLMAVALLGYAGGYLTLQLAAGVVGILVGVVGLKLLTKH